MAAVSVLSSTAAFTRRCETAGLSQPWVDALKAAAVNTLGKLSYAVSLPGTPPSADDLDAFTTKLRPGVDISIGDNSALKQLIFEAQTFTVAELRATVQEGEGPKKLPSSERTLRLEQQKVRLTGLCLEGPLAVAHCLYDRLATMREQEELKYISPAECITRDAELCNTKPPKALQLDANKAGLIVKDEEAIAAMSIDTDLQLYQAMIRRALAFDLVGLATFSVVQRWVDRLFMVLSLDPPPEFQKVTRAQVLRADRQAFIVLSRACNGALKAKPDGSLPLDAQFSLLEHSSEVMYFVQPAPIRGKGGGKGPGKTKKRHQGQEEGASADKKAKVTRDPIPEALKGMHARTPQNKPICFSYNLGKCKAGAKCKFLHVCCKPGCYKPHPVSEHDSSKESE